VALDTITLTLPHGQLQQTLATGIPSNGFRHGIGVVVCPDDNRVYMAAGKYIVVADAVDPRILATVGDSSAPDDYYLPLCVLGDSVLYVTLRVMRFDRRTLQWLPRVAPSYASIGIVQSRADPNLLYVGESYTGGVGIIDRAQAARIGSLALPPAASYPEWVPVLAVLPGDTKIYVSRSQDGGILAADPATGEVSTYIAVGGPNWPGLGFTDDFVLSHDDRWLYVAVKDGDPRGVVVVDTQTDRVVRTLPLADYVPQAIALSPSGQRLFVTTQDRWIGTPSYNVLIDVPGWSVLEEFARPRAEGVVRFDGGIAFRGDGKLAFVAHDLNIDVFLIRE
jgi:DNA-binding beta-propeller fold protein YncE